MAKFFINRPIVAIVIALLMVIAGGITMFTLPTAQFPNITDPQVSVNAFYPGADSETIAQSVATPIAQQMAGVDGMNYMDSQSASTGSMSLTVDFGIDTNADTDQILAQIRVAQANSQLPQSVVSNGLTVSKSSSSPLMLVDLYSPAETYDSLF